MKKKDMQDLKYITMQNKNKKMKVKQRAKKEN